MTTSKSRSTTTKARKSKRANPAQKPEAPTAERRPQIAWIFDRVSTPAEPAEVWDLGLAVQEIKDDMVNLLRGLARESWPGAELSNALMVVAERIGSAISRGCVDWVNATNYTEKVLGMRSAFAEVAELRPEIDRLAVGLRANAPKKNRTASALCMCIQALQAVNPRRIEGKMGHDGSGTPAGDSEGSNGRRTAAAKKRTRRSPTPATVLKEARERHAVKILVKRPGITSRQLGQELDCNASTVTRLKAWTKRGVNDHPKPPRGFRPKGDTDESGPDIDAID